MQPERDPELHENLVRMWLRQRLAARSTMWGALQRASTQRVVFDPSSGDSPVMEGPFTAVLSNVAGGFEVDIHVSDSFKATMARGTMSPGNDFNVASFHASANAAERAVLEEIKSRTFGAAAILKDAIFKYRFQHAFGRDTGTVLRVAQQGSEMRKRLSPPADFVAKCRERGLFEWQTRQVWAFTALPRSVEWREAVGDGKGVRVFLNVHEPGIRISVPRSRVAGAMVNGTGFGKTVMALMIPLLPMWGEAKTPVIPSETSGSSSSDPRRAQMEAMRAKDRAIASVARIEAPLVNVLSAAGVAEKQMRLVTEDVRVPPGSVRAGVLIVVPPHLVMQWVAELFRMGFVEGISDRPNFLRYYDMPAEKKPKAGTKRKAKGGEPSAAGASGGAQKAVKGEAEKAAEGEEPTSSGNRKVLGMASFAFGTHRVVLTSFRKFSDSGSPLVDTRLHWSTVIFDESQLATTKTVGRMGNYSAGAYERARSQVNATRILALSASPMAKDARDLRAWLKDGYRDIPQHSLVTMISGFSVPIPPCVASEVFECFFNEKVEARRALSRVSPRIHMH